MDNISEFDAATIETALKAFYVDDLLKSVPTEEIAIKLVKELIELLKRGGFRLTKFTSNSNAVLDSLPASEVPPSFILKLDDEENIEHEHSESPSK